LIKRPLEEALRNRYLLIVRESDSDFIFIRPGNGRVKRFAFTKASIFAKATTSLHTSRFQTANFASRLIRTRK
jgi:hypothetical protein